MEVIRPQDMQSQSQENTRTRKCAAKGCVATVVEHEIETARYGPKVFKAWVQDEWPSKRGFCNPCEMAERVKEAAIEEARRIEAKERWRKHRIDEINKAFGGEKPATEFTFDRFDGILNFPALEKARNFDYTRQNLFLYGAPGTGKTHLACALAREQVERGINVEFFKVPGLMREFRRRLDPDEEEEFIKRLVAVPVLVIDDLGVGKATEYVVEKLHEVIDGRQNNYRSGMVLTSNLSLNGIAETFKDRIADRLNGMCDLVKMDGDSHRKRKA